MSRARVFGVVCAWSMLFAAAGCGDPPSAFEDREGAATVPPGGGTMPPVDVCAGHASGPADATLTMGVGITKREQQLAAPVLPANPLFWSQSCPARVVDVLIPSTSSPNSADCQPDGCYTAVEIIAGAGFFSGSSLDSDSDYVYLPSNATTCEAYRHFARLYKKLAGQSAFTLVRQFDYTGDWANGFCTIKDATPPPGQGPYFPNDLAAPTKPPSGTDTYRVVAAVQNGIHNYVPVRFKAGYEPMQRER